MIKLFDNRYAFDKWLPKDSICCEMGVDEGKHACSIMQHTKPKELHCVDFWTENSVRLRQAGNDARADQVLRHKEEAVSRLDEYVANDLVIIYDDNVTNVLPTFPDNHFDWVYIDTFHSYTDIKRDIGLAISKIKTGGLLCGHDLIMPPAYHNGEWVINQSMAEINLSVLSAVFEFINAGRGELVAMTKKIWGDWAVRLK